MASRFNAYTDQTKRNAALRSVGANALPVLTSPATAPATAPAAQGSSAAGAVQSTNVSRPPALAAPGAAHAAPAAAPATDDPVIGHINGRPITRSQAEAAGGKAPTATGPVVADDNGNFAYATGTQAGAPPAPAAVTPTTPALQAPQADTYFMRTNDADRRKLLSNIDDQLFELRGNLNSRSRRELAASLIGQQSALINGAGAEAENYAGGDRDAAARYGLAEMEQGGANQRAVLEQAGASDRAVLEQAGANARQRMQGNQPQYVIDDNGNYVSVAGSTATPVTSSDGKPFKTQTKATLLEPKDALDVLAKQRSDLTSQINALSNGVTPADPKQVAALQAQIDSVNDQQARLLGGKAADGQQPYQEGQIYTDAKGNRARFVNGKFVPEK